MLATAYQLTIGRREECGGLGRGGERQLHGIGLEILVIKMITFRLFLQIFGDLSVDIFAQLFRTFRSTSPDGAISWVCWSLLAPFGNSSIDFLSIPKTWSFQGKSPYSISPCFSAASQALPTPSYTKHSMNKNLRFQLTSPAPNVERCPKIAKNHFRLHRKLVFVLTCFQILTFRHSLNDLACF